MQSLVIVTVCKQYCNMHNLHHVHEHTGKHESGNCFCKSVTSNTTKLWVCKSDVCAILLVYGLFYYGPQIPFSIFKIFYHTWKNYFLFSKYICVFKIPCHFTLSYLRYITDRSDTYHRRGCRILSTVTDSNTNEQVQLYELREWMYHILMWWMHQTISYPLTDKFCVHKIWWGIWTFSWWGGFLDFGALFMQNI